MTDSENREEKPDEGSAEGFAGILAERREKLDRLRASGVNPFPHSFPAREDIASVLAAHEGLEAGAETDSVHRITGRITARRGHGKAAFIDLRDATGQIQVHAKADVLGDPYALLDDLDLGDFIGVEGRAIVTRRGQLSIEAGSWQVLAKALRPPPDKFHGLEDTETRYRRRELDLIANNESREIFRIRARTVSEVRRWLDDHGFFEVETPVLQPLYGGALARPFVTHHNALDRQLFLRIATELYLKRCVVGGIDKVYELGKDFRNEGISMKHNPEFTMLEWYEAYADYGDTAAELEELVSGVSEKVLGKAEIERDGRTISLAPPWHRITLRDAIVEHAGIDIDELTDRDALSEAIGNEDETAGWGKLVDTVFSREVEPKLIEPTFILDYPEELSPFAKQHREKPGKVERWEAFIGGVEIANSFTELNDPDEQRRRFEQQAAEIDRGDDEAQPFDESFIEALEQGMPPTGGVGLGIDRLVMMLTNSASLREVVLFPAMRD
ncbi:MAG: lysine--tRNA ligase [Solirubrobacterales bacterium]|nr:lysine--tRNA ligase [Solirubrobacterales bacterium]MCB8915540.1 lysine--tRNA ligase [Thermoleophilales bacterium]